jgi:hypothetical protein
MSAPIQLTVEQQETLLRLAAQSGKPCEEILEAALTSFEQLKRSEGSEPAESVYAAIVRLGLLGSVTDGPPDLSTNPQYMEGFGSHGD